MPVAEIYQRITIRTFERHTDDSVPVCTDPFGVDDPCTSEAGHQAIASCGDVACIHCGKVFWQ